MSTAIYSQPNFTLQNGSAYRTRIEASIAASCQPWANLGLTYSAGILTVAGMDGTALSAANPAWVRFQSKATPGYNLVASIEANQTMQDDAHATSEIIGNLFGWTTGVAVATDVPFFIYACLNDDGSTVRFGISRVPNLTAVPATANIGTSASAVADVQYGMFLFESGGVAPTVAEYDTNPCVVLGAIRMQMSASDDWTVQTLSTADGFGRFHENTFFNVPLGQFGATAGSWIPANGGTAPVFTTYNANSYKITRDGMVWGFISMTGDGGTDGSGAVNTLIVTPFDQAESIHAGIIRITTATVTADLGALVTQTAGTQGFLVRRYATMATNMLHSDFANGARTLSGTFNYRVRTA